MPAFMKYSNLLLINELMDIRQKTGFAYFGFLHKMIYRNVKIFT